MEWEKAKTAVKNNTTKKEEGGIAVPSITVYYQAVLLDNLVQWWNVKAKYSWEMKQIFVKQPLSEWPLSVIYSPNMDASNINVKILSRLWKKLKGCLAPGQLPLASFLDHPEFQQAVVCSNFQICGEKGISQFYRLGKDLSRYPSGQLVHMIGDSPTIRFQVAQLRYLVRELSKQSDVFRPLTNFELFLVDIETKEDCLICIKSCCPQCQYVID